MRVDETVNEILFRAVCLLAAALMLVMSLLCSIRLAAVNDRAAKLARDTLSYYGLYLKTTSPVEETDAQRVGGQSVAAGTALDHGSVITVTLIDSDETMLGIY